MMERTVLRPFHVALPVRNLASARAFYRDLLGCREGRSNRHWVDFDLFGHQIVCHLAPRSRSFANPENEVDGRGVPVPHCGVVLTMGEWRALAERLERGGAKFLIEPTLRFVGRPGEQGTFFLADPSGNALEFKGFEDLGDLFSTR